MPSFDCGTELIVPALTKSVLLLNMCVMRPVLLMMALSLLFNVEVNESEPDSEIVMVPALLMILSFSKIPVFLIMLLFLSVCLLKKVPLLVMVPLFITVPSLPSSISIQAPFSIVIDPLCVIIIPGTLLSEIVSR